MVVRDTSQSWLSWYAFLGEVADRRIRIALVSDSIFNRGSGISVGFWFLAIIVSYQITTTIKINLISLIATNCTMIT